jgi:tRNA-dihydrouridine synthase 1
MAPSDETAEQKKERKKLKKLKKEQTDTKKKRKKEESSEDDGDRKRAKGEEPKKEQKQPLHLPDLRYILAPMVGASELAFRLLCRKYGATLAYTPMMDAARFAQDAEYRKSEFQTCPQDRPLVCHFSANTPEDFTAAAVAAQPYCDAIDLNLGCPQRTAHVGHFGSYLLGKEDRELVVNIIRTASQAVKIPICVKIRLLQSLDETVELVQQLHEAGASWIAIHARYRATWDRKGPGARDGAALLDQVQAIREKLPNVKIIANGNIITHKDCEKNLALTKADGVMSAEGILDNPALFLPRYGKDLDQSIELLNPFAGVASPVINVLKTRRKLEKKLREIQKIEAKLAKGEKLIEEQKQKLTNKSKIDSELTALSSESEPSGSSNTEKTNTTTTLGELTKLGSNKLHLANEYLSLVRQYPITIRTVVFHTRRMLCDELKQYQLMDDCVAAQSVDEVQAIVDKLQNYKSDPQSFQFDREKAAREKEEITRKKHEEGKRKRFEERMVRKAKREGKDLEFYLRVGAVLPTVSIISKLKKLSKEEQLQEWKKNHSQHCIGYHLDTCKRDRGCCFLHVDPKGNNSFVESDEVAG